MEALLRQCRVCLKVKPIAEFRTHSTSHKPRRVCRPCCYRRYGLKERVEKPLAVPAPDDGWLPSDVERAPVKPLVRAWELSCVHCGEMRYVRMTDAEALSCKPARCRRCGGSWVRLEGAA